MSNSSGGPGWMFPEYEFVRILGRGSAGWVALARHRPLDRHVAIKTVYGGQLDTAATARLRREGRALALLSRPTIVGIRDVIVTGESVSLVMEYVPGGDLGRALDAGEVAPSDAVAYLRDVADALTAAAGAGVTHRDVKPANVLLDGRGGALLGDFGLARFPGAAGQFRTVAGAVTGTPLYMAPEQQDGFAVAGPAVDAYAFAVLAYRSLTGVEPFRAATLSELRHAHRTARPTPPWEVCADFPRPAGRAILAGLAKDPEARISPAELAGELAGSPAWRRRRPGSPQPPLAGRRAPGPPSGTSPGGQETGSGPDAAGTLDGTWIPPDARESHPAEATRGAPTPVGSGPVGSGPVGSGPVGSEPVERWVQPPVYTPPRTWNRRRVLLLCAVLAGLALGVVAYLVVRA